MTSSDMFIWWDFSKKEQLPTECPILCLFSIYYLHHLFSALPPTIIFSWVLMPSILSHHLLFISPNFLTHTHHVTFSNLFLMLGFQEGTIPRGIKLLSPFLFLIFLHHLFSALPSTIIFSWCLQSYPIISCLSHKIFSLIVWHSPTFFWGDVSKKEQFPGELSSFRPFFLFVGPCSTS